MTISREVWVRELKILATFGAVSLVQTFFMCRSCTMFRSYLYVGAFTFAMWIILWRGNGILTDYLSEKISWIDHPGKRFVTGVFTTVAYTLLAVITLIFVFDELLGFNFGGDYKSTVIISVGVTLLISLFLHCREFLLFWRKASFDMARFQRESVTAKYESLKSQVNPSFLFHSLNTLSGLIYENEEQAVRYIKSLADVYRYMLDTRDKEIVPVSAEIHFLDSYAFLLKRRYGIDLRIDTTFSNRFVPPSAFHMIIEKLLPHDNDAGGFPPWFAITAEGSAIILEFPGVLTGTARAVFIESIENIRNRYMLLTNEEVAFQETGGMVRVTMPLLTM